MQYWLVIFYLLLAVIALWLLPKILLLPFTLLPVGLYCLLALLLAIRFQPALASSFTAFCPRMCTYTRRHASLLLGSGYGCVLLFFVMIVKQYLTLGS